MIGRPLSLTLNPLPLSYEKVKTCVCFQFSRTTVFRLEYYVVPARKECILSNWIIHMLDLIVLSVPNTLPTLSFSVAANNSLCLVRMWDRIQEVVPRLRETWREDQIEDHLHSSHFQSARSASRFILLGKIEMSPEGRWARFARHLMMGGNYKKFPCRRLLHEWGWWASRQWWTSTMKTMKSSRQANKTHRNLS